MDPDDDADLLCSAVVLPEHVVLRDFSDDVVALNLRSGQFHGLNATANDVIRVLVDVPTARDALPLLQARYDVEPDELSLSVVRLLRVLRDRGLVELTDGGAS